MHRLFISLAGLAMAGVAGAQSQRAPAPVFPLAPPPPYVTPETAQGGGKYPAVMEADAGLPTHTVYRPKELSAEKLPIVVFGNGACVNVGNRFRYFLSEIASHGFLAIAIGPMGPPAVESISSGSAARGAPAPGSPAALRIASSPPIDYIPADTTALQLTDGIDWAIRENSRAGSAYFGKLDTAKVAVMGQSCGGLQAIAAAHDRRVSALGVWNSGLFANDQRTWDIAAANATKAGLHELRVPVIYVTGEPSDVAFQNADDDFARIEHLPVLRLWREKTGHGGTYREPNGGAFGTVAVAWLKWQLKGDSEAARMFLGAGCGLCGQPEWHIKKKNLD
ncbi:MAG: alpha/beta hydrolase [Telluria sp.]|nr:alpha/beta hydrolase [Telluria sp.]